MVTSLQLLPNRNPYPFLTLNLRVWTSIPSRTLRLMCGMALFAHNRI